MKIATLVTLVLIMLFLVYLPSIASADTRIFTIAVGAVVVILAGIALTYNVKRL
jgi:hypothetical protein